MKRTLKKPYLYWTIGIFVAYMALNIIISQFYVTILYIPYYLGTINWAELLFGAVLSVVIGMLVSVNSVFLYIKYQERKSIKKDGALACAAAVGGLATGVCPACAAGLIPFVLGIFGVSFGLASLPLKGKEIQILAVAILAIGLYWNSRSK